MLDTAWRFCELQQQQLRKEQSDTAPKNCRGFLWQLQGTGWLTFPIQRAMPGFGDWAFVAHSKIRVCVLWSFVVSLIRALSYSDVMLYIEFRHLVRCIKRKQSYHLLKTVKSCCSFGVEALLFSSGRGDPAVLWLSVDTARMISHFQH